jgi:hypothetical protein
MKGWQPCRLPPDAHNCSQGQYLDCLLLHRIHLTRERRPGQLHEFGEQVGERGE